MIRAIGWIDVWPLQVQLYRHRALFDHAEEGVSALNITRQINTKDWAAARSITGKALQIMTTPGQDKPILLSASIEKLFPKTVTPWEMNDADLLRFHVPILTNPLCNIYSSYFSNHLPVGQLTFVGVDVKSCAANHGDAPRYHLIIDVKKPEPEFAIAEPEKEKEDV